MGKAIIIPNVNWSSVNFGEITPVGLFISGSSSIYDGLSSEYTALYAGDAVNVTWSIEGNGTISTTFGSSVTVTPTGAGSITLNASYNSLTATKQITINTYIQDGLVFNLDGINKGVNEGKWTDLVGGVQWTNYNAISLDNGWSFANGAYMLDNGTMSSYSFANCTVEMCIDSNTSNNNYFIFVGAGAGIVGCFVQSYTSKSWFTIKPKSEGTISGALSVSPTISGTGKFTISITGQTNGYGYWNGVKKSSNNVAYNAASTAIIGKRVPTAASGSEFPFTGTIHSIRIYNRILSNEEMLSNQIADNIRFNLGLTI